MIGGDYELDRFSVPTRSFEDFRKRCEKKKNPQRTLSPEWGALGYHRNRPDVRACIMWLLIESVKEPIKQGTITHTHTHTHREREKEGEREREMAEAQVTLQYPHTHKPRNLISCDFCFVGVFFYKSYYWFWITGCLFLFVFLTIARVGKQARTMLSLKRVQSQAAAHESVPSRRSTKTSSSAQPQA